MKTFITLLRYTFLNKKNRRQSQRKWLKSIDNPIYSLIPGVIFAGVIGVLLYQFFSKTNVLIPFFSMPGFTFLDVIFILWSLTMSFMFIFTYAPFISINLFENDDISFLMTLPVKKIAIFGVTSLETLMMAGIPIFMIFPIIIDYAIVKHIGILFPALSIFGFTIFLIAISNAVGIIMSKFTSKTSGKILGTIVYFITMVLLIIVMNTLSPDISKTDAFPKIMAELNNWISFLASPFLFTTWVLKSAQGSIIYTIILYAVSAALAIITYIVSKKLDFSISRAKKNKRTEFSSQSGGFPFLRKDLKLVFRDPQSIYMILYILIFPLLMAFFNKSIFSLIIFQVAFSSFYAALIPVNLLRDEINTLPLPFILPIDKTKIITTKTYLSVFIFSTVFIISLILGYLFFHKGLLYLATLPFIMFIFCYEALYGVYYFFKNPKRDTSRKMVLTTSEMLLVEMSGMFMSFIIILLFSYISLIANIPTEFNILSSLHIKGWLIHLVGGGFPLFIILLVAWDILRIWKRIKTAVMEWE